MSGDNGLKIAVLLGDARLDTLRRGKVLAEALLASQPILRRATEVTIGLPVGDDTLWRRNAAWLTGNSDAVTVRRLSWERVLTNNAKRMFVAQRLPISLQAIDRVTLPRDWGSNFLDCDRWMVVAGADIGGVYPGRPTAIFCSDLSARRVPFDYAPGIGAPYWQLQTDAFRLWRQSAAVVASDPVTAADLLYYAGVSPDRIVEMSQPLELDPQSSPTAASRDALQLLLRVEPDARHSVDDAILALQQYLLEGGRMRPVIATEALPIAFGRNSNIPQIALLPSQARELLDDIPIAQIVSHERWQRLLDQAAAVWMAREAGCDGAALRQALRSGKPILAPATPQSDRASEQAGGALLKYGTATVDERVDALHRLEELLTKNVEAAPTIAPERSVLNREIGFILDRMEESSHG